MPEIPESPPSFWREVALDISDFAKLLCVVFVLPPLLTLTASVLIELVAQ